MKQMSRCPWCRTDGDDFVQLAGREVCRSCEESLGGSVIPFLTSPYPDNIEPEYDQYVAVSTEIWDPSSGSASYISDEEWARLIVETCVQGTSGWSGERDRPDEPGRKKVDWLLTWDGRSVALEVASKQLPDDEVWRAEGDLKIREPGAVGGSVHDPPIGLCEAVRRVLQTKLKAGQFPEGHEKWIFMYVDALYVNVGGVKQPLSPQFEYVFLPRHTPAQAAQEGHLEEITRMVESFPFYDQVWLARRGGQRRPWLVARWVRDRGRSWNVVEVSRRHGSFAARRCSTVMPEAAPATSGAG